MRTVLTIIAHFAVAPVRSYSRLWYGTTVVLRVRFVQTVLTINTRFAVAPVRSYSRLW